MTESCFPFASSLFLWEGLTACGFPPGCSRVTILPDPGGPSWMGIPATDLVPFSYEASLKCPLNFVTIIQPSCGPPFMEFHNHLY